MSRASAPAGKLVTWTGITIVHFACGRIPEEWPEVDGLSRPRQLGVIVTPAP